MRKKLLEEIAANTLCMSQSLIGRTRFEIAQDKGIIHTFCDLEGQSDADASILFFISKGISFGCYFPTDIDCKLVNIPLTLKDVDVYRNYCNAQYEIHETADDSWYNRKLKTFITIFFDTDENSYMLTITEFDSHGVN